MSKEGGPEKIASAVIRYQGKTYAAKTHLEAVEDLWSNQFSFEDRLRINFDDLFALVESGFLTTTGRFVSYDEAPTIAEKAKQWKPGTIFNSAEIKYPRAKSRKPND